MIIEHSFFNGLKTAIGNLIGGLKVLLNSREVFFWLRGDSMANISFENDGKLPVQLKSDKRPATPADLQFQTAYRAAPGKRVGRK